MVFELAIIGGGFWGTACALMAKDRGIPEKDIIILDDLDKHGASKNAAGIIDLQWYKGSIIKKMLPNDWTFEEVIESVQWIGSKVKLYNTGEIFSSYLKPEQKGRHRKEVYIIEHPQSFLKLAEDMKVWETVTNFYHRYSDYWTLRFLNGGKIQTRKLILAAGYKTDELLENSGFPPLGISPLRGTAIIVDKLEEDEDIEIPKTYLSRPFVSFTLRKFGNRNSDGSTNNRMRFGDTTPRCESPGYLESCLNSVLKREFDIVERLEGMRPISTKGDKKMRVQKLAKNLVAVAGGHRVGFGLSGLIAKKACQLLDLLK